MDVRAADAAAEFVERVDIEQLPDVRLRRWSIPEASVEWALQALLRTASALTGEQVVHMRWCRWVVVQFRSEGAGSVRPVTEPLRCRWYLLPASFADGRTRPEAAVAQLVEQGTENPCVNSSILFGGILFE